MKVALINPGKSGTSTAMPLGLGYLAAYVKDNGHDVVVKDMEVEPDKLEEFLIEESPQCVGISVQTLLYPLAQDVIKRVRKTLNSTKIVVGGPHVSAVKSEMLKDNPEVDIAVYGEGEITFLEVINGVKLNQEIPGICYRLDDEIKMNPPREFIKDLDSLPYPAWHLFPISKYRIHPPYGRTQHFMNVITSRGCPYRCAYCSKNFGNTYRKMSPERVVSEIDLLVRMYGVKEIHFYDDDFTIDQKRASEICDKIIEKGLDISWSCTTRVDLVSFELLKKMKKSGCWLISFGVESGNQQILNTIRKGYTLNQVRDAFKWTKQVGIKTVGFFMLGLPGETKETIKESIKLAKEIKADYTGWAITTIYPGTDIINIYRENGARIYPAPAETLAWMPKQGNNKYALFAEENLTHKEMSTELKKIRDMFYFNPRFILKEIMQVRSVHGLLKLVRTGINLLKSRGGADAI